MYQNKKITVSAVALLTLLKQHGAQGLTKAQLKYESDSLLKNNREPDYIPLNKATGPSIRAGSVESKLIKGETIYRITKAGLDVLNNLKDYEVVKNGKGNQSTTGKRSYKKAAPAPVFEPPQMNISLSADNLMDNISAVVQENAIYRDLILKTCRQWAGVLGMQLIDLESPDSDN